MREVKDESLRALVEQHLAETRHHAARVEQAFAAVGSETSSNLDPALDALLKQHEEQASNAVGKQLVDLVHAGAAIRTEHAELAIYDVLLALVEALGLEEAQRLLAANREEELRALELLDREASRLAAELAG